MSSADPKEWRSPKFNPDGTARFFPGNTIICHVPRPGSLEDHLTEIRAMLTGAAESPAHAFLPASSWHMTIFEVMNFTDRSKERWLPGLDLSADPHACHAEAARRLTAAAPWTPELFHMRATGIAARRTGSLTIALEPVDPVETARIRGFRDRIASVLGIRRPDHDSYQFHITLAYRVQPQDDPDWERYATAIARASNFAIERLNDVRLGPAEFCRFESMLAFDRLLYLGRREGDSAPSWVSASMQEPERHPLAPAGQPLDAIAAASR